VVKLAETALVAAVLLTCGAGAVGAAGDTAATAPAYETVAGGDWGRYRTTAELRAARLFWWFRRDADANDFVAIVPDATFGQVCRITFPENAGAQGSAPRMKARLPTPLERMWFRWRVRFSPGWTTRGPDPPGHANSYKLAFWLWEGYEGRGEVEFSNTSQYILGCSWGRPGERLPLQSRPLPGSQSFGHVTTEWTDGEWYEFVVHYEKVDANTARQRWWRRRLTDGGRLADAPFVYTGIEIAGAEPPRVAAVELGANKNKNTPREQFISWGPWEAVDGSRYPDPFGLLRAQGQKP
jgi:hypothetical protein